MRIEWRTIGLVAFGLATALAVITVVNGFIPYPTADNLATRWDHYRYIAMSRHPFEAADPLTREAPYCWRILGPILVYLSPLDWRWSFMLLTLIGLSGAALTLYFYLAKLGYTRPAAIFGLGLFFSLAGLIFNLRDYYLSDPLAFFAIALGFYLLDPVGATVPARFEGNPKLTGGEQTSIGPGRPSYRYSQPADQPLTKMWDIALSMNFQRRGFDSYKIWLLLLVLTLGVTAKETVLALLPLIFFAPKLSWRAKTVLAVIPTAALIALRLVWPAFNDYSYFGEAQDVLSHKFWGDGLLSLSERLNFALLGTWGPTLVLVLYRPAQTWRYMAARPAQMLYLAIIYGQLVVAHNVDRLLVYGFVVVIPLLVTKAALLSTERKLNLYWLLGVTLALQLVYFYGRPPLWSTLLVCVGIIVWLWRPVNVQHLPGQLTEQHSTSATISQKRKS